jgi:hypothetical protein
VVLVGLEGRCSDEARNSRRAKARLRGLLPLDEHRRGHVTRVNVKPLAKAGFKVGWLSLERGRELVAYLGETMQDTLAEARHELVSEAQASVEKS